MYSLVIKVAGTFKTGYTKVYLSEVHFDRGYLEDLQKEIRQARPGEEIVAQGFGFKVSFTVTPGTSVISIQT